MFRKEEKSANMTKEEILRTRVSDLELKVYNLEIHEKYRTVAEIFIFLPFESEKQWCPVSKCEIKDYVDGNYKIAIEDKFYGWVSKNEIVSYKDIDIQQKKIDKEKKIIELLNKKG